MKRKLLFALLGIFTFAYANSQTISIVGSGVNGWPPTTGPEITLSTSDNIVYTISDLVMTTGEVKFRQDLAWDINWGSNQWPSGTATQGGANIPSVAGTYDVTFNRTTGEYSFVGSAAFPTIGVWGPAVDPINGFGGDDIEMTTQDGEEYVLSGFTFSSGAAKFRQDDNSSMVWSNVDFPAGIAVADGPNILVEGGDYTVYFNRTTLEYNFEFPSVGVIGSAVGSWDVDVDMATEDGIVYTLMAQTFVDASPELTEIKFRQDDSWTINWGTGGINPDVLILGGSNISVSPGVYDIMFNRQTLEFSITPSLGVGEQSSKPFRVFPNPTKNEWNFASQNLPIDNISISDLSGKIVLTVRPAANETLIDASMLASGTYFAKVSSANAVQNIKIVKQ